MELRVIETDFATDLRWDRFVESHPEGLVYHHSLWLAALRNEFGQDALSLACVDENNEFKGIFPLLYTRGLPWIHRLGGHLTGKRLASLPRTPLAGPLSVSREADSLLLQEAVRRVMATPGTNLQIKMNTNRLDGIIDGVKGDLWRDSYVLELPKDPECNIRFGNSHGHHRVKSKVKKAVELGVTLREAENEDDLFKWYRLYLETMRRVVVPPRPRRFFHELWLKMRPRGLMRFLLAEKIAGRSREPLAGSIFLMLGQTFHYAFTGCNALALVLHANDLLLWEAIHSAARKGYRHFDFGEVAAGRLGLARFKSKWSAKVTPLYRYQFPGAGSPQTQTDREPSSSRLIRVIWQGMPLCLTGVIGSQLFRRL